MRNIHQTFKRPQVFVTLSCFTQGGQNDCLTKESLADIERSDRLSRHSSESLLYNQMTFHTSPLNVVTVAKARKLYAVITAAEGCPCQCDFPSQIPREKMKAGNQLFSFTFWGQHRFWVTVRTETVKCLRFHFSTNTPWVHRSFAACIFVFLHMGFEAFNDQVVRYISEVFTFTKT